MDELNLNSIGSLLSGGGVKSIAKRLNMKQSDVAKVLSEGIPAMLSGMHDNASAKEGEASLSKALSDHENDNTDDVTAFLKNADLKDGKKILGHVFGDDKNAVLKKISKDTGVTKGKAGSILALAAPLLLTLLAKKKGGILSLLGGLLGLGGSSGQQSSAAQTINLTGSSSGTQNSGSSGNLLSGLLGGGSGLSSLGSGLLGNLMGGVNQEEDDQQSSGGLLSGFLNLFRGK